MKDGLTLHNPPASLISLAEKWWARGHEFYLGPENLFYLDQREIMHSNVMDIPREIGSWHIHTPGILTPSYRLSMQEMKEIIAQFALNAKLLVCFDMVHDKCNLHCNFCSYQPNENHRHENKPSESLTEIDAVNNRLDMIAQTGVKDLVLGSGAEFLTYPLWKEYIKSAAMRHFNISLISNGVLATEGNCRFLSDHGVRNIYIH